jgi:glycosyltransferase involved in cell wall biosynthesis
MQQHEVARLITESDIVCLPSVYASECQPLAIIDAMYAGRKVLVSNSAPLKATVENYPAELVDPISVVSIQNGLINLMNKVYSDHELSIAVKNTRLRFSISRFDNQIRNILLRAAN